MTGEMILELALAFIMEKPGEDKSFSNHALNLIKNGIADIKPIQESRDTAENAPPRNYQINAIADHIPLDDELCNALTLYLVAHFLRDDFDLSGYESFIRRYEQVKQSLKKYTATTIHDVYGGDEDA